jgi:LmbE family N-acetylglucosaminyl deacetylase
MNPNNPFLAYVETLRSATKDARGIAFDGGLCAGAQGPAVLLFSPHPDDECITGLFPLRLMRECGYRIINVPVTFGSDTGRRQARLAELRAACGWLGWEMHVADETLAPLDAPQISTALAHFQPAFIFLPHAMDWNSTHLRVHHAVMEALASMPPDFSCRVVETEFWGAMDDPNVMVEGDSVTVADLVAATALHTGEVVRNPYHLHLPAWMQDNVRRGAERIGGQGSAAPDFDFATLYRIRSWQGGALVPFLTCGLFLSATDKPSFYPPLS